MAEVKVLIEGYAYEKDGVEHASSTTTLIKENDLNILIDPGMNRKILLDSLKKENITPENINYVIVTHTHLDHCFLVGIFPNAKILDDGSIYTSESTIEDHDGKVPETDIEIIKTPGHDQFHCSVIIDTEKGKIVVASDVFWWTDDQEQKTDKESLMQHEDPYVKDKEALMESRRKLLEMADYIIPGHGKMFKVEK